ncbi:MAG TPA: hypothetical protein DER09_06155 [Prolixibacteraceae bacterium]|nr:hypothetical protein [Prolixibacteraceae bacterium]
MKKIYLLLIGFTISFLALCQSAENFPDLRSSLNSYHDTKTGALITQEYSASLTLKKASVLPSGVIDNGWNNTIITSIGANGSDYYAQSFIANVTAITSFGVVIQEISAEGQISLAIAEDNGGVPNYAAPLYVGTLKNPTMSASWYYETGLNIPVTVGKKYYVLLDGYNNAGATGYAGIGMSSVQPIPGEALIWSNNGGVGAWNSYPSWTLAIHVVGTPASAIDCNPIDVNLDENGNYKLDSLDMIELTGVTPDSLTTFDDMKIFAYPDTFTTANIEWPVFVRVTSYDKNFVKARCWAMVTVHDATPPTVVGNDIEVMLDSAGLAVITKEQVTDSATFDVSGIVSTAIDKDTFTCENIGENWVMLSATDIYGNVGTDSVLVTVSTGLPNLDSIQDINITLATGVCETVIEYPIPVLTQICGISATQTAGLGRDAMFPVGTTTEAWTIIDHKGDTALVSFDVIVTSPNAFPSFNEIDSITVGDTLTTLNIAVSGISAGTDCMPQTVTVIAETDNNELIDSLTVAYTEGDTTGTVTVSLVAEMTGTANIKVTVTDSEGASMFRNFDLVVNAVPKSSSEKEGQIATAVWTKEIETGINIYPNPTQNEVTIDIRNYTALQTEVAVFTMTGSEVLRKYYPVGETIRFSMNEQVSGVYLIKMNIDGNHIVKKLVVDKK